MGGPTRTDRIRSELAHNRNAAHGASDRYRHGVVLARLLVERFPERCLWGTDWRHPNHSHIPDDGILIDALADIAPDAAHLERVLVSNPASFYRFGT